MEVTVTSENFESLKSGEQPLVIDFWATSCGPCRQGIKESEAVRKELRENAELDFLFITDEVSSPEKDYTKYVAEHLDGEDVVRVSKSEFAMYEEMFKFLGIPHYVMLDPEGRMINEIGNVHAEYPNMCSSKETFEQYFNTIKTACEACPANVATPLNGISEKR